MSDDKLVSVTPGSKQFQKASKIVCTPPASGCVSAVVSGKTNREWCSENGIAYSSFMRWQALLRDEAAGKVMEQQAIVPVKIAPPALVNSIPANESHLEIRIQKDGVSISLPSTLPAAYILEIVKGLA